MTKTFRAASIVALSAALGVAACSSKPAAPPPPLNEGAAANANENATAEAPPPEVITPPISEAQSKSEPVSNPNELPSSDGAGPTPQVRDDADAAGMTARLPDSGDTEPAVEK
jgi:hypothetical protein